MKEISVGLERIEPSIGYKHSYRLVYFATLGALSEKMVVYSHAPPGFGKSWLNILIACYVTD